MSTHTATAAVPEIVDTLRRAGRTAIQAGGAVITVAAALAAVYQAIVPVVGVPTRGNLIPWVVAAAVAVAGNAALYARIMAIPAVNAVLDKVRLGGQSTIAAPLDSETRLIAVQTAGDGEH